MLHLLGLTLPLALLAQAALPSADPTHTEDTLRRRADWRTRIAEPSGDSGAAVRRVDAGSAAERAGLRAGDRIVAVNGKPVTNLDGFSPVFQKLRGGDSVRARVVRTDSARGRADTLEVRFVLDSVAHERIPGTVTTYGAIRSERGYLLRSVVSRPERSIGGKLPGVLFIPWLSCDPVEKPVPGNDGFAHMLRDVASHSGMVVMRVEKPGLGDSEGPDCRFGGLDDERASHRAGLKALRSMPEVDPNRIYLLGGSIGGALAPILAAEQPEGIAGVIAVGGYTLTWYEHMLDIERRRLTLSGVKPAEVNAAMRGFAQFYTDYLIGRKAPGEVLAARPELKPLWYDEPGHQYGRPAAYYQAVQQLDVENAWAKLAELGIPALVVRGDYDWIMGPLEAERPVEIVNATRPGLAKLVLLPKTDHGLMAYESMAAAFNHDKPRNDGGAGRAVSAWLKQQASRPATAATRR
ncbi:MAG TPA: alpha/beta fold hydrolase [Gemmatimonadales bacterium]|nr:alpha/beta fold hydrolase [Gemmatimonadales bacterium]